MRSDPDAMETGILGMLTTLHLLGHRLEIPTGPNWQAYRSCEHVAKEA